MVAGKRHLLPRWSAVGNPDVPCFTIGSWDEVMNQGSIASFITREFPDDAVVATNTIHHSADQASRILVPLVK